jgi:hypothetical protein
LSAGFDHHSLAVNLPHDQKLPQPRAVRNLAPDKGLLRHLTTALIAGVASAQTNTGNKDAANTSATVHKEGEWRASKLAGVDVYNEANEKIGDINDVILDKSGKAEKGHPRRRRISRHG